MLSPRHRIEDGVALVSAIALLIIAAFIVGAIMISARASSDSARAQQHTAATDALARDAGAALVESFNALQAGEHNGYVLTVPMLRDHADRIGGTVVKNSDLGDPVLEQVDSRVPDEAQATLVQDIDSTIKGYWQIYSVKLPQYGVTKGGRVLVYVRAWTASPGQTTKPTMYRLEFRPTWFADYQIVVDGPFEFGANSVIDGRAHSNGYTASFYNQYRNLGAQIKFDAGSHCSPSAVITTAGGTVEGEEAASCSRVTEGTHRQFNFLRARDAARRIRQICEAGPAAHPSIEMSCPAGGSGTTTSVHLSGDQVVVNGSTTLQAGVAGDAPGARQGAVVIAPGNVQLHGTLAADARVLVVAATPDGSTDYGTLGAPSIWLTGDATANAAKTSSLGLVAEGDVVFDELTLGSPTVRGAILTMTGLVSHNPRYRVGSFGSGTMAGTATIEGSIAGHFPPIMYTEYNHAGFSNRLYRWNPSLFDNPPPLYPTAADWEVTKLEVANLDCFAASGKLDTSRGDCT